MTAPEGPGAGADLAAWLEEVARAPLTITGPRLLGPYLRPGHLLPYDGRWWRLVRSEEDPLGWCWTFEGLEAWLGVVAPPPPPCRKRLPEPRFLRVHSADLLGATAGDLITFRGRQYWVVQVDRGDWYLLEEVLI